MSDIEKPFFPATFVAELHEVSWLEPWWCFCLDEPEFGPVFDDELRKELHPDHVLHPYSTNAKAFAKREDCDDVLFWMPDAEHPFAIVHLTWKMSVETDAYHPRFSTLGSLTLFVEEAMRPTHADWSGHS